MAAEEARLREWAEKHRKLKRSLPKQHFRGAEHIVEFNERRNRAFKATRSSEKLGYGLLKPKNAKIDDEGVVHPIDPVIQRITPEFADFMRNYRVQS